MLEGPAQQGALGQTCRPHGCPQRWQDTLQGSFLPALFLQAAWGQGWEATFRGGCFKNSVIMLAHRSPQCCKNTDHVVYSCIRFPVFLYHGTELFELLFAPSMVLATHPEVGCREG